jgi:hypothetical protein
MRCIGTYERKRDLLAKDLPSLGKRRACFVRRWRPSMRDNGTLSQQGRNLFLLAADVRPGHRHESAPAPASRGRGIGTEETWRELLRPALHPAHSIAYQGGTVFELQLVFDVGAMGVDSAGTDVKLLGNVPGGAPLPNELQHLQFAIGQSVQW